MRRPVGPQDTVAEPVPIRVRCCLVRPKATAACFVATIAALAAFGASPGIASADPPPPPPPQPKTTIDHDGTYSVGTDIDPGTYSSAGPVGSGTCYWKRVGGPSGGDVVDNALSKKPQVVQIDPGDKTFKTDGCQPWQKTDAASADGLPPLGAQSQLRTYVGILNGQAPQFGGGQLPPP